MGFDFRIETSTLEYLKMSTSVLLMAFINFKIAKHVIKKYNAIKFKVGFMPFLGRCTQKTMQKTHFDL